MVTLKQYNYTFNYLYGKPKETKDVTINTEQPLFDLNDI